MIPFWTKRIFCPSKILWKFSQQNKQIGSKDLTENSFFFSENKTVSFDDFPSISDSVEKIREIGQDPKVGDFRLSENTKTANAKKTAPTSANSEEILKALRDFSFFLRIVESKTTLICKERIYLLLRKYSKLIKNPESIHQNQKSGRLSNLRQLIRNRLQNIMGEEDYFERLINVDFRLALLNCNIEAEILKARRIFNVETINREFSIISDSGKNLLAVSDENAASQNETNLTSAELQEALSFSDNISQPPILSNSVMSLADSTEIIQFEQAPQIIQNSWIVIQGLPYTFDIRKMTATIISTFEKYAEIEKIYFQQYKDFKENVSLKKSANDPEEALKKMHAVNEILSFTQQKEIEKPFSLDFDSEEMYFSRDIAKSTKKTLEKLNKKKEYLWDKSLAFIKTKTLVEKKELLTNEARFFGVLIGKICYRIECAEIKRTLQVSDLPSMTPVIQIMEEINDLLAQHNIPTFEIPASMEKKLTSMGTIFLTFKNFETSMQAFVVLKEGRILNGEVSCMHLPGQGTIVKNMKEQPWKFSSKVINIQELQRLKREVITKELFRAKIEEKLNLNENLENPKNYEKNFASNIEFEENMKEGYVKKNDGNF